MEVYADASARPYAYLLIDMHPKTEEHMRLKSAYSPLKERILLFMYQMSIDWHGFGQFLCQFWFSRNNNK